MIDFRPVDNLEEVLYTLVDKAWDKCEKMSSPSQLLCHHNDTNEVFLVDCSVTPPTRTDHHTYIADAEATANVTDMCTSNDILVILKSNKDVCAYLLNESELKRRVSGELPGMEYCMFPTGIAVDEQGYLYVCDNNNRCVHILSDQDGTHLGVAVKEGMQGVGIPYTVAWHSDSASFIVGHEKGKFYHLNIFSRQY